MTSIEESEKLKEEIKQRIQKEKEEKDAEFEKQQKLREKSRQKAKQKYDKYKSQSFWAKYSDYFAYSLVVLIMLAFILFAFSGDRRKLSEIPVNEDSFISKHNNSKQSFKLGTNEFFKGMTLANVKEMANNRFSTKRSVNRCNPKQLKDVILPEEFNFYTEYPNCKGNEQIRTCSSSYAEVPLSIMRNRNCKLQATDPTDYSLDFLFACDKKNNDGCKGGYIINSLEFLSKFGIIQMDCWEKIKSEEKECPTQEKLKECTREYIENYCVYEEVDEFKKEIFQNGPIALMMIPYRDFLVYKGGVYVMEEKQKVDGFIIIKLIGWTLNSDGSQSWIVDPMWGKTWGEEGIGKIKIGSKEALLDHVGITMITQAQQLKMKEIVDVEAE